MRRGCFSLCVLYESLLVVVWPPLTGRDPNLHTTAEAQRHRFHCYTILKDPVGCQQAVGSLFEVRQRRSEGCEDKCKGHPCCLTIQLYWTCVRFQTLLLHASWSQGYSEGRLEKENQGLSCWDSLVEVGFLLIESQDTKQKGKQDTKPKAAAKKTHKLTPW